MLFLGVNGLRYIIGEFFDVVFCNVFLVYLMGVVVGYVMFNLMDGFYFLVLVSEMNRQIVIGISDVVVGVFLFGFVGEGDEVLLVESEKVRVMFWNVVGVYCYG